MIDEHRQAVLQCVVAANLLAQVDLEAVIAQAQRGLDFGPFLDPTLWRAKHEALREDLEVLRAARPLAEIGRRLQARRSSEDRGRSSEDREGLDQRREKPGIRGDRAKKSNDSEGLS